MAWSNNMSKNTPAAITEYLGEDYTKVTFSPDLAKFKLKELSADMISLFQRRVVFCSHRLMTSPALSTGRSTFSSMASDFLSIPSATTCSSISSTKRAPSSYMRRSTTGKGRRHEGGKSVCVFPNHSSFSSRLSIAFILPEVALTSTMSLTSSLKKYLKK